jgi:undecaprenyl-diphosphatase
MTHWIIAVIQGIVEGLTEFIPVSSTGHLILTGSLLGFEGEKASTFEVFIQLGAILAVVILYWQRFLSLFNLGPRKKGGLSLVHIIVAMIPASVLGLVFHDYIKNNLFSPKTVLLALVVGGILLIVADKIGTRVTARNLDQITVRQAFGVGLFQCLSLWSGFSRSGATISGGMIMGMETTVAAEFSFLLAVPMMIAASGLDLFKAVKHHAIGMGDLGFFALGFIVSFLVALVAIVWFLKLLNKVKLTPFAIYRFIVAALYWAFLLRA